MKIQTHEIGAERNPVVIIDDFLPEPEQAIEIAARIAPFAPVKVGAYPGLRHQLSADQEGAAYVVAVLKAAAPLFMKTYSASAFAIHSASFSIVTQKPDELELRQRLPHTDSPDPNYIALLHHLHHLPNTGTAFYRHRRTGFEKVSEDRRETLRQAWAQDSAEFGEPAQGFFAADARYENIFEAEARFNRLVIYQGALFHSGVIPPDFAYDPDPRRGRLTGNIFVSLNP